MFSCNSKDVLKHTEVAALAGLFVKFLRSKLATAARHLRQKFFVFVGFRAGA